MDYKIFKNEKLLMITVLLTAFVIRILNIRFGYPLQTHTDEPTLVKAALEMIKTGDLNPHSFQYPSLTIYLQALLFFVIQLPAKLLGVQLFPAQLIDFHVYGRALNVFFSTATIYFVYEIGRRLFGAWTGLAAMLFLSVSSAHVMNAYFATVDTLTAFWPSVVCLIAVLIYTNSGERKLWHYLVGGICVGLATSSKYTAFLSFLPILVAHGYHAHRNKSWFDKYIVAGLLAVPVGFFITTPYAFFDFQRFYEGLLFQSRAYTSHFGSESLTSTSFHLYFNDLFTEGYGEIPTILAFIGLISLLFKKRPAALMLISFPLALFIFLGLHKVYFFRNFLPAIPFMALLSGYGIIAIAALLEKLRSLRSLNSRGYRYAAAGLIGMLILFGIQSQIRADMTMIRDNTLPDTRWVSLKWIQQNIPPGTRIGREFYTPPIEQHSDQYSVIHFDINGVVSMVGENEPVDVMVASSYDYSRFIDHPEQYPWFARIYSNFFSCNQLIREFVEDGTTMSGPTIRIYRMNHELGTQACMAR